MKKIKQSLLCLLLLTTAGQQLRSNEKPGLFYNILPNIRESFIGWNSLFHLGAIGVTFLSVQTGLDREIHEQVLQGATFGNTMHTIAYITGYAWNVIPSIFMYFSKERLTSGAGAAGLQAILSTFVIVGAEKMLTGRLSPAELSGKSHIPSSHDPTSFSFDFWNRPITEYMWPSGHAASAFAFVSAMTAYYPGKKWIPWVGYPFALALCFFMIDGNFHWFSDLAAGALIGHSIGWTTGKNFRKKIDAKNEIAPSAPIPPVGDKNFMVFPTISTKGAGVTTAFRF